jgi:hypothetical protein
MKKEFCGILIMVCAVLFAVFATPKICPSGYNSPSITACDFIPVDNFVMPVLFVAYEKATPVKIGTNIFVREKGKITINRLNAFISVTDFRNKYHLRC